MKQKYTLSIADMEINVITDEPQESVEHIVGMLDRKIREISLKSRRCSKNEAALLCALDFCADKIKYKEQAEELEDELEDVKKSARATAEKLELTQKNTERLEREKLRLEGENARLRTLLEQAKAGKQIPEEELVVPAVPAHEMPVGDIYAAEQGEAVAEAEAAAEEQPAPTQKKKPGKNRVGSMFDLLTFSDI